MTNEQTQSAPIRVETIERSAILHTIEVEVDAAQVRKAFDRAYRDLAKQVRIKGFRPGKAPRSVLEKLHGASVAEQLEHTLVADTLADAIELAGIQPVSEPAISAGARGIRVIRWVERMSWTFSTWIPNSWSYTNAPMS